MTYLDVEHLDLSDELQDLVLDLADLERVRICTRRGSDLRVEVIRLGALGSLTHVVHSREDVRRDRREVDVSEGGDEDCVGLRLCVARDAVADLELRVASGRALVNFSLHAFKESYALELLEVISGLSDGGSGGGGG